MNILYVVTGVTGDERAIIKALETRGHAIEKVFDTYLTPKQAVRFDLILFNHSKQLDTIAACDAPKVAWCFDLITHPTFQSLDWMWWREAWARSVIEISDLAFYTDGDFVDSFNCSKVHWLTQGACVTGQSLSVTNHEHDITFAGSVMEDTRRIFFDELNKKFDSRVNLVVENRNKVFDQDFAELVAKSKIMIAPPTPIKSRYWSNRVWMVLGYGGFLLHPYIPALAEIFKHNEHIVYYRTLEELYSLIRCYLANPEKRESISTAGMKEVIAKHTYQHRVDRLLEIVQNQLCLV